MKKTKNICARCRMPIENRIKVVTAKDGAVYHGRCWGTK